MLGLNTIYPTLGLTMSRDGSHALGLVRVFSGALGGVNSRKLTSTVSGGFHPPGILLFAGLLL
jgi:hypothetical protein